MFHNNGDEDNHNDPTNMTQSAEAAEKKNSYTFCAEKWRLDGICKHFAVDKTKQILFSLGQIISRKYVRVRRLQGHQQLLLNDHMLWPGVFFWHTCQQEKEVFQSDRQRAELLSLFSYEMFRRKLLRFRTRNQQRNNQTPTHALFKQMSPRTTMSKQFLSVEHAGNGCHQVPK